MASLTVVSGMNVAHYDGGTFMDLEGREVSWMEALTSTDTGFFRTCPHCVGNGREVMVNFFCLDCADPHGFCSKCAHKHEGHRCLQVRLSPTFSRPAAVVRHRPVDSVAAESTDAFQISCL